MLGPIRGEASKTMSGMGEIAKRSVTGTLILSLGNLVSTAINAVSIILIARMLGPSQYGLYTLALVIPGLLQNFIDFGVGSAVIRYSAYYNSMGKVEEARRFTANGIRFLWLTAMGFAGLNFVLAGTLSALLLHRPDLANYVRLMSLSVLGNGIFQTAITAVLGWMRMDISSLSQIMQSIVRLLVSPLLILIGFGVFGALTGQVASVLFGGVFGTVLLYTSRLRGPKGVVAGSFASDSKAMLRFGLPLYVGTLITGLATYYVTIILALIVDNATFGFYQAALNFLVPVNFISAALVNSLFPAFASVDGVGGDRQEAFRLSYKFVAFLLTPLLLFMVSASSPLVVTLYGSSFAASVYYLRLLALAYLPIAFGYSVHSAFFNGFGRTKLTMLMNSSGAISLLVCAPLFAITFRLGVTGLILATLLSYFVPWLIGTTFARVFMGTTMDFRANGLIVSISVISYAAATLAGQGVSASPGLELLLLYIVVFFGVYLTLAPLTRLISEPEIDTVDKILVESRLIGRVFAPIIRYQRLILALTRRKGSS
jgi:O-antigen/teichoic acid export membrane protein